MVVMIHLGCGKPAFWVDPAQLIPGAYPRADMATHLDGSPIEHGAPMVCESCGEPVLPSDLQRDDTFGGSHDGVVIW